MCVSVCGGGGGSGVQYRQSNGLCVYIVCIIMIAGYNLCIAQHKWQEKGFASGTYTECVDFSSVCCKCITFLPTQPSFSDSNQSDCLFKYAILIHAHLAVPFLHLLSGYMSWLLLVLAHTGLRQAISYVGSLTARVNCLTESIFHVDSFEQLNNV